MRVRAAEGVRAAEKSARATWRRRRGGRRATGLARGAGDAEARPADDAPDAGDPQLCEARLHLRYLILGKYSAGLWEATDVAAVAYWVNECGVPGFADLAYDPKSAWFSKNASRKVSEASGLKAFEAQCYMADIPMCVDGRRCMTPMPFNLIHELLPQSYIQDPSPWLLLAQNLKTHNWREHPLRKEFAGTETQVFPFGAFLDKACYKGQGSSRPDSVIAMFINNIGRRRRHPVWALQSDNFCGEACNCPCRGRCSIQAAEQVVLWSARCAAAGENPTQRHDGLPFTDMRRRILAGTPLARGGLRIRFVLLEFRGDWLEYCEDLGFPYTKEFFYCFKCKCPRNLALKFSGVFPFDMRTHSDYMEELKRCTVTLLVNAEDLRIIWASLQFDFRQKGMHGRITTKMLFVRDLNAGRDVQLCPGDRLEAGGDVLDTHCAWEELPTPANLVFFRKHPEVWFTFFPTLFQFPYFRFEYLMLDTLHMLDLGVTARLIGTALQRLLSQGMSAGASTKRSMLRGLVTLNIDMRAYYLRQRRHARLHRQQISSIDHLTLKMLGIRKNINATPTLKAKGAETRHLLPFVIELVEKPANLACVQHGSELLRACKSLQRVYDIIRDNPRDMGENALQELHDACMDVGEQCEQALVAMIPKFHMLKHIPEMGQLAGNAKFHSTYEDEAFNRDIVRIIQSTHTADFLKRLLAKCDLLEQVDAELSRH